MRSYWRLTYQLGRRATAERDIAIGEDNTSSISSFLRLPQSRNTNGQVSPSTRRRRTVLKWVPVSPQTLSQK
jgi:hypothetical protein